MTPDKLHRFVRALTQGEQSEDQHDLATYVLHTANWLTGTAVVFAAIYLLAHGLITVDWSPPCC